MTDLKPHRNIISPVLAVLFGVCLMFLTSSAHADEEWFKGGNLHRDTLNEWIISTNHNKVATCADFVAGMTEKRQLRATDMETLKEASIAVAQCVEKVATRENARLDFPVQQAAVFCMKHFKTRYPFLLTGVEQ